jgi:hypothetical protein
MASKQTAHTEFTANADQHIAEYHRMREADKALEAAKREAAKVSRELAREEKERLSQAAQMTREVMTPLEQYRQKVEEIERAYESGSIDQETYNRQLRLQKTNLDQTAASSGLLDSSVSRLALTTLGMAGAFTKAAQAQQDLRRESEETARVMDELTRKFAVQAGLNALQARDARQDILGAALTNAVGEETAFDAATMLVSQGFAAPQKSGALDAFLKIVASSNLAGENPDALIEGMGQFMTAFGLDKNRQNLMELGVRTRGLFKDTPMQVGDLAAFSGSAGVFAAAGISLEDTLAANAILREQMGAAEAATQGRNVVGRLQTFAADKGRMKVLQEQLGLEPGQIDLTGESLEDALGLLGSRMAALPEEQRAPVLSKLFGQENLRGARALLNNLGDFDRMRGLQRDQAGFVAGVQTTQSGLNAAMNRAAVTRTIQDLEDEAEATARAIGNEILENEDALNLQRSGTAGDVALTLAKGARESARFMFDIGPDRFLSPEGRQQAAAFQQSDFTVDALVAAMQENTEELKAMRAENREAAERPQQVEVISEAPPAFVPSPAEGLSARGP